MLLGNYSVLNRNPLKFLGGSTVSPEVNYVPNFFRGGARKNRQYVGMTTAANKRFSLPYGSYPPYMTLLPQVGGDLAARRSADFGIDSSATGGRGLPGVGTADISIDTNNPAGGLVVTVQPGNAPATIGISTNAAALTASISGTGASTFGMDLNTPILGAIASLIASGAFGMDGSLVRYAIGIMEGTTADTTTVTNASVAAAVWNELLASHVTAGSAGLALSTASSGGVDPNILAAAVWAYVSRTLTAGGAVPADIAAAVLAAAQTTPINANTVKMNTNDVIGTGLEGNPWRGVGVPP